MCELVIQTAINNGDIKMSDTEILKKVIEYLENTESESVSTDIKEYSENLLFWIENWQN
jgi:hypothetical protein